MVSVFNVTDSSLTPLGCFVLLRVLCLASKNKSSGISWLAYQMTFGKIRVLRLPALTSIRWGRARSWWSTALCSLSKSRRNLCTSHMKSPIELLTTVLEQVDTVLTQLISRILSATATRWRLESLTIELEGAGYSVARCDWEGLKSPDCLSSDIPRSYPLILYNNNALNYYICNNVWISFWHLRKFSKYFILHYIGKLLLIFSFIDMNLLVMRFESDLHFHVLFLNFLYKWDNEDCWLQINFFVFIYFKTNYSV